MGFPRAAPCSGLGGVVGSAAPEAPATCRGLGLTGLATATLYPEGRCCSLPRPDGARGPRLISPDRSWGLEPATLAFESQQCLFPAE